MLHKDASSNARGKNNAHPSATIIKTQDPAEWALKFFVPIS